MIIDTLSQVDVNATVTGGTTVLSVSAVDISVIDRALGTGRPLYLVFHIINNTGGDGADTMRFDIVESANADLSSSSIVASSKTITGVANLPAGSRVVVAFPPGFVVTGRYVGAGYAVTATAVLTVTAHITDTPPSDTTVYNDTPGSEITV